jgi:excinuclease ABC subunit A
MLEKLRERSTDLLVQESLTNSQKDNNYIFLLYKKAHCKVSFFFIYLAVLWEWSMNKITIKGARVNNLQDVSLEIPQNKLICLNGPSGSGKSSLAFHTIYAESKRRFFNSFPNYMKLFAQRPTAVDIDSIYPVLPVFALPQINPVMGARSCISDNLRLTEYFQSLFYYLSQQYCSKHEVPLVKLTSKEIIEREIGDIDGRIYLFIKKDVFLERFRNLPFPTRCLVGDEIEQFDESHSYWELLRFKSPINVKTQKKLDELGALSEILLFVDEKKISKTISLNSESSCPKCSEVSQRQFSAHFNPYNALGACSNCSGYGATLEFDWNKLVESDKSFLDDGVKLLNYKRFAVQKEHLEIELKKKKVSLTKPICDLGEDFKEMLYKGSGKYKGFDKLFIYLKSKRYKPSVRIFIRNIQKEVVCTSCDGTRLGKKIIRNRIRKIPIADILILTIEEAYLFFKSLKLTSKEYARVYKKILSIFEISISIGLGHLKLLRKTKSVSAGEYQRLLLVKFLSYEGTGALFVFDEPSLGLSIKEQKFILKQFRSLIDDGNTVILVEHSPFLINNSDHIITMGPGAGHLGGKIVYQGKPKKIKTIIKQKKIKNKAGEKFQLQNISVFDTAYKNIKFSSNQLILIKGESGTGKSAVFIHALGNAANMQLRGERLTSIKSIFNGFKFPKELSEVILIDSNLNKFSSRSSVGSLTDLSTPLRKYYSSLTVSKVLGLEPGHFSPNSKLGQCSECEGRGHKIIEMQYLEDIIVECDECKGKKLRSSYADITDNRYSISEAYRAPVSELFKEMKLTPKYQKIVKYMEILNLNYLSLDRKIKSLSGGEKQRIYLLSRLVKNIENSLILVENITFGLSINEVKNLCEFFDTLCLKGNTIIVIDQNPLLESFADDIISM